MHCVKVRQPKVIHGVGMKKLRLSGVQDLAGYWRMAFLLGEQCNKLSPDIEAAASMPQRAVWDDNLLNCILHSPSGNPSQCYVF